MREDSAELETPLPSEDEERRWPSSALLVFAGAGAIAVCLGYFFLPRGPRPIVASTQPAQVSLLTDVAGPLADSAARTSVVRLKDTPPMGMRSAMPNDLRAAPGQPATFLDVVRRTNAKAYVGRLLRFDSVNVVTTPTTGVLSVGPDPSDSVMVKVDPPSARARARKPADFAPGDKVCVVGWLMPTPTEETMRRWGLTQEDEDQIGHRSLYIRAMVVQDAAGPGAGAHY